MMPVADRQPGRSGSHEPAGPAIPWLKIAWVLALLLICYFPILRRLVDQWISDPDLGHGFFVPVVAAYVVWTRRDQLLQAESKPNYWGLVVVAWGAAQLLLGTAGAELFLQRSSLIVSLAGCILLLFGTRILRLTVFPLLLLIFMVPLPQVVFNQITFRFQLLASQIAESALNAINIPALRDGNIIELANQKLSVVEACSGIRSLLSLSFLSLVYAFFFDRKVWMRWALLLLTVPIAIAANAGRVTITGVLSYYRPELAQGVFHSLEGWVIFIADLVLLLAAHHLVNFVYRGFHARKEPVQPV